MNITAATADEAPVNLTIGASHAHLNTFVTSVRPCLSI